MDKLNKIIFSLYSAAQDLPSDSFAERAIFLAKQLVSLDSAAIMGGSVFAEGALGLQRTNDATACAERDRQLCGFILPHLFQAREINQRILSKPPTTGGLEKISLVANLDGRTYFVDEFAIGILQTEWPGWDPTVLPSVLIEAFKTDRAGCFCGRALVARAVHYENLVCVQVSKKPTGLRLSNAEREAAQLVADGLTYKEVARRLNRAPATVRNQLHSAYKKLGIKDKHSLRAALASPLAEPDGKNRN